MSVCHIQRRDGILYLFSELLLDNVHKDEHFMKKKRRWINLTDELWLKIKAAALKNNRKIIGELEERFKV